MAASAATICASDSSTPVAGPSQCRTAARGAARLADVEALPCLDSGAQVQYFGSISKSGDNADWDWGFFQDEKGEWILAEDDGPGCIFNFTQHRYPTSPVPVFRFYFEGEKVPRFEIKPEEFGTKAPFLKPVADAYIGPEENGRGPIRVVRSFVPMEFRKHFKITSSIPLRGFDKARGEGGWGHVIYQRYDTADGLETFDPKRTFKLPDAPRCPAADSEVTIKPGECKTVFARSAKGVIKGIRIETDDFVPDVLRSLRVRFRFDGQEMNEAPVGTFFGCEYGDSSAVLDTALLHFEINGAAARWENRFPMPFFEKAELALANAGDRKIAVRFGALCDDRCPYRPEDTGLFSASKYHEPAANRRGENSVIAEMSGRGQMVYGVLTGKGIGYAGCEGDVRVFIDGMRTPSVESDGSESWASYGWGFVTPPQCNPFSCYHGVRGANHTWSECRLTFTDAYAFRGGFRLELEHGETNNGGGFHSGQCFFYSRQEPAERLVASFEPKDIAHDGTSRAVRNRFENGIHEHYVESECVSGETFEEFRVKLPERAKRVILKRTCLQNDGPMSARVFVDGAPVEERVWTYCDFNPVYSFLDDCYTIPEKYISGRGEITIRVESASKNWNFCGYRVYCE